MNPRLSLAALTVLHLLPPDMITCAADAGYGGIGLRLLPATPDEPSYPTFVGDSPLVREVEQRVRDTGLRVLDIEIFRLKPDTNVPDYLPALETGARLGARNVLVAANDPEPGRLAERFAAMCALGAPLGLAMNIEPMPWTHIRTLEAGLRLVEASGHASAAVLVDAIHFDRAGDSLDALRKAPAHRLHYLQLCDPPAERPRDMGVILQQARTARMMPGDGGLDLVGLLRAAPQDLPISLEVPMPQLMRQLGTVEAARQLRE